MRKSLYTKRQRRLCALLKEARKKAKLSQTSLGRRLGTYKSFVSRYERGQRRLDVIEFLAVAKALRLDPIKLLRKVKA
jgi:transcriptional regulator with XRE-family HTH domain